MADNVSTPDDSDHLGTIPERDSPKATLHSTATMKDFSFLESFTPEIRNRLYNTVISSSNPHLVAGGRFQEVVPPLFKTCKQIWKESREMLLPETTFRLDVDLKEGFTRDEEVWIATIGKSRVAKFRQIQVSFDPERLIETSRRLNALGIDMLGDTSDQYDAKLDHVVGSEYLGALVTFSVAGLLAASGFKREQVQFVPPSKLEYEWLTVEMFLTRYVAGIAKRWSEHLERAWDRREQKA